MTNVEENKEKFIQLLRSTKRDGIESVITSLDNIGFFDAPASSKYHGAYAGGLCEHSLNVYQQAMYIFKVESKINPRIMDMVTDDSLIISALLHDVCKGDLYKRVKKWRKDENNKWEEYETYESDHSNLPVGHGEKSVIRLLKYGLDLHEDEILAIRWHMSAFDISDYYDSKQGFNMACSKTPLVTIIMSADILATRITEGFVD